MTSEELKQRRIAKYASIPKMQIFNGIRFCRDDNTGYYRAHSKDMKTSLLLHRYVYEFYNGKIPKGYDIHHKNGDKGDNDITNLELVERHEHRKMHAQTPDEEVTKFRKENMDKQRPLTKVWHASEEGHEWHRNHAIECKKKGWSRAMVEITCCECGAKVIRMEGTKFCCPAHKAKWRRKLGIDDEDRVCPECKNTFRVNKYSKQKYCSRECSSLARGRAMKGKVTRRGVAVTCMCKKCGKEFRTDACNQKYCYECAGLPTPT